MIILKGNSILGDANLTNLSYQYVNKPATNALYTGQKVYSPQMGVDVSISSISSPSTLILSSPAISSVVDGLFEFSEVQVGVYHERNCALIDAKAIIDERGMEIRLEKRDDESEVGRDDYNSLSRHKSQAEDPAVEVYIWKSYPINDNPNTDTLRKCGLREQANVAITLAMEDLRQAGFNTFDLSRIRSTVIVQGLEYEIGEVGRINQNADTFLNVTLGLRKK